MPSAGEVGHPENSLLEVSLPPGDLVESVQITGLLTQVRSATYASELQFSADLWLVPDGLQSGLMTLEAYESFDDGPGVDQVWSDLSMTFTVAD